MQPEDEITVGEGALEHGELVAEHGARLPRTVDLLRSLPGFGRYTAGAVSSIAFDEEAPLVDGNVARVLSRVLLIDGAPGAKAREAALWDAAGELVKGPRPGDWNQALMELGATVCAPTSPRCLVCPVRSHCVAAREGDVERYPEKAPRAAVPTERWSALDDEQRYVLAKASSKGKRDERLRAALTELGLA